MSLWRRLAQIHWHPSKRNKLPSVVLESGTLLPRSPPPHPCRSDFGIWILFSGPEAVDINRMHIPRHVFMWTSSTHWAFRGAHSGARSHMQLCTTRLLIGSPSWGQLQWDFLKFWSSPKLVDEIDGGSFQHGKLLGFSCTDLLGKIKMTEWDFFGGGEGLLISLAFSLTPLWTLAGKFTHGPTCLCTPGCDAAAWKL